MNRIGFTKSHLIACVFCLFPIGLHSLTVEDFEAFEIGDESEKGVWTVVYDKGSNEMEVVVDIDPLLSAGASKVLRIAGKNNSYNISIRTPFSRITETPVLSWKWKVTEYPEGANISDLQVDDSAAQIYVNFDLRCTYLWYPCVFSICYFYGTTMDPGATFLWSGYGTYVKFISVRSVEEDGIGTWFLEERNVVEDYGQAVRDFLEHEGRRTRGKFQKAYESALSEVMDSGGDPMLEVHSVAIWVDSNDTRTAAESFWDDVLFLS